MTDKQPTYEEMLEIAGQREHANREAFFRYYVCDYYATGEGRTVHVMVDRNYDECGGPTSLEFFLKNIDPYLHRSVVELDEETFLNDYGFFLPEIVKKVIEQKDVPGYTYQAMLYCNYA